MSRGFLGPQFEPLYRLLVGTCALLAGCGPDPVLPPPDPGTAARKAGSTGRAEDPATPTRKVPTKAVNESDRLAGRSARINVRPVTAQAPSPFRFQELPASSGIDFRHFSGMTKDEHFPTANGSGVAILDYDGDGKLDLYFCTATLLPLGTEDKGPNRLYRNKGDGTFEDVTESAGVGFRGFCHGAIVGDIDNDGDPDLFLCNYGRCALFENRGDGTFADISRAAGIDRPGWASSGAFLDHDNDGDLDLYVSQYGEWVYPDDDKFCGYHDKGVRLYCSPRMIRTVKHVFYRNNGDRTFTEVTDSIGLGRADGHGFGVVAADLDGDGRIDLYVANDMNPAFLYLNNGDGTFRDATDLSGAGMDVNGNAQAGMGVDAEDVDGDGRPELFKTHFANEYNTLYQNMGNGAFFDQTAAFGLAADSMPWVGWGCLLGDFDNDGWPDCFVTNGHVDDNRHELSPGAADDYAQPPLLYQNVGMGSGPPNERSRRFKLATRDVGPYFDGTHVGRGAAFGDLDDDGDLDIVVNHKDGAPGILLNGTPTENRWIRLKLVGTTSNRDAIGAKIEVTAGKRTIHRQRKGGVSMMSSHDPRVLIGVGEVEAPPVVVVRWPSGKVTELTDVATNRTIEVVEPRE